MKWKTKWPTTQSNHGTTSLTLYSGSVSTKNKTAVAHLGVAVDHESLQIAESNFSTAHRTVCEDSARANQIVCR